jgi:Holliday junction resolvasome RuvABC endonuclease subunit
MSVAGVDYSLSCPCLCLMEKPDIQHVRFYYLTTVKKDSGVFANGRIEGVLHQDYFSEQERYDNIAEFFVNKIPMNNPPRVFIEDYSFGSTGRVFHIAENCGLFKYKLWEVGYKFDVVAPSAIKKFATGKGNADKAKMYEAFVSETGLDLQKLLFPNKLIGSPAADIVDSYYIAKFGYEALASQSKSTQ